METCMFLTLGLVRLPLGRDKCSRSSCRPTDLGGQPWTLHERWCVHGRVAILLPSRTERNHCQPQPFFSEWNFILFFLSNSTEARPSGSETKSAVTVCICPCCLKTFAWHVELKGNGKRLPYPCEGV